MDQNASERILADIVQIQLSNVRRRKAWNRERSTMNKISSLILVMAVVK